MTVVNLLRRPCPHTGDALRFLKPLFVVAIAMLPLAASSGELIVYTLSAHFRPNDNQNNNNFGISYFADTPCRRSERFKNNIIVGAFYNTHFNPSAYAGCYFKLFEYQTIEIGAMVGLATGYDQPVKPAGLLIGTYRVTDTWNLRVSISPLARGVATLSVSYRL